VEVAREREATYDWWLFGVTVFLILLGVGVVLDTSFARALQGQQDEWAMSKRQGMWAVIALITLGMSMRTPYYRLRKYWFVGLMIAVVLLALVLIPGIGTKVNGARRWIKFGPVLFQPSEFAKIVLVFCLAAYSEICKGQIRKFFKGLLPALLVVFAISVLVAKEDLGTSITIMTTGLLMLFMMGARPAHMFGLILLAGAGGVVAILVEPFRMERIWAWLDPLNHATGVGYQPAQGLIALGSGGVWGKGIGRGVAKHMYLPAEHTDYIFATIGEEAGLMGCLALVGVFAFLVIRGLTVAHRSKDRFGSLIAAGLTCIIGVQAMLNIAVVTALVPCTGVPLPFISYGGSSLVFTTLAVGIILSVSQHSDYGIKEARQSRESPADRRGHRRAHLSRPQRRPATDP